MLAFNRQARDAGPSEAQLNSGLAADRRTIWVANHGTSTVTRLDRATGAVVGTYTSGRGPFAVAFDGLNIWVANFGGSSISTTLTR